MRKTDMSGWNSAHALRVGLTVLGIAAGCTSMDDPPEGGQCPVPLSYPEKKNRCDAAFTHCLGTWIQGVRSKKYGHSQCHPCRDLCMRNNGVWPDEAFGGPCR